MLKELLTSPFLLRRLIRSNESIAGSLTRIANSLEHSIGNTNGTLESLEGDDTDLSYASNLSTYIRAERDKERLPFPLSDEEGS